MEKSDILSGYEITTDPNFLDELNAITPELSSKLEYYHELALDGKKSSIKKIQKAIERHPKNPQLKNYLSVLYGHIGDTKKMYDVNKWILAEHPNYLFGKLNLANEYYLKDEYDKMPQVLGETMDLKALYPDRNTFHLNEVISFLKCAVLYYTAIGNIDQAEIRYEIMEELAPDAYDTEVAMKKIFLANSLEGFKRFQEEEKNKISVKTMKQEAKKDSQVPDFNHEEIELLYSKGLRIGIGILNDIRLLPRKTLIQDLELVLQDSIDRYEYFSKNVEENGWDEERMNFVIHAIYILAEIKASESLESIFTVLSQSEEYIELYLGDFCTSMLWEPVYQIAKNQLEACKQFMYRPGIDTYVRTTFPDMVEQLALHEPERREEALKWFKDVMQFFLDSKLEDNVIDSDFIALLICNIIDINGSELLPEIEKLFEKGFVSVGICGTWEQVCKAFERPDKYDNKKEILSTICRYEEVLSSWSGYKEETNSSQNKNGYLGAPAIMPIRTEPKIGRNSPCPCGSGKKYKKCCLDK